MSYLLHIAASPLVAQSQSRDVANTFLASYLEKNPDGVVRTRDLAVNVPPALDAETIFAGYVPEDSRPPSQQEKHAARIALVDEIKNAQEIVVSTGMYNWNVPASLKAYIDNIVIVGVLDAYGAKGLTGKKVTIIVASGGAYGPGTGKEAIDFCTPYLQHIFSVLGSTDIHTIRTELTLAGVSPGMEAYVDARAASHQAAKASADSIARK